MSVGQIYRYFDGKDAIIAAIVRQDVEEVGKDSAEAAPGTYAESTTDVAAEVIRAKA